MEGLHGKSYEGTPDDPVKRDHYLSMPGDVEDRIEEMQTPGYRWLNPDSDLFEPIPAEYLDTAGKPVLGARWLARSDRSLPIDKDSEESSE